MVTVITAPINSSEHGGKRHFKQSGQHGKERKLRETKYMNG